MNKETLIGRLTNDPDIRYSQGEKSTCVAKFYLAVARKFKREGEADTDFINCVVFGKLAESVEKYLKKGMKIALSGRIQTGSYTNRDGAKIYTTDIVVEEWEFVESNNHKSQQATQNKDTSERSTTQKTYPTTPQNQAYPDGFMSIPDGVEEELPFI